MLPLRGPRQELGFRSGLRAEERGGGGLTALKPCICSGWGLLWPCRLCLLIAVCQPLPPPSLANSGLGRLPPWPLLQSHFLIQNQEGYTDIGLVHPAASHPQEARRFVSMPCARVARPVTLQPGEAWCGEMKLTGGAGAAACLPTCLPACLGGLAAHQAGLPPLGVGVRLLAARVGFCGSATTACSCRCQHHLYPLSLLNQFPSPW